MRESGLRLQSHLANANDVMTLGLSRADFFAKMEEAGFSRKAKGDHERGIEFVFIREDVDGMVFTCSIGDSKMCCYWSEVDYDKYRDQSK